MSASITTTAAELAGLLRRARESGDPSALVDALPYMRFLHLAIEREGDGVVGVMRYAPDLIGDTTIPALHGGTLCALLESTAVFSVLWSADEGVLPKTITMTVDYLRSGRPVDTRCRASIVRQGKRIAVVDVRAYQDDPDKPITTAIVHLLLSGDGETA